jgi:hypothetical protein
MLLGVCLAIGAIAQDTQVTVSAQDPELEVVMVLPETDREMARSLLLSMPPSQRTAFVGLIRELKPEVATVVVRGVHNVNMYAVTDPDPGASWAEDQAYVAVYDKLDTNDQATFKTAWETDMTPAQKTTFLTVVRGAHFGGYKGMQMTPPPVQQEPMQEPTPEAAPMQETQVTGEAAQPMLNPMASLPEPARAAFARFEPDLDNAEKVAYARNLMQITPDQAALVAEALANLNEMGKSNQVTQAQRGIHEDDAIRMMASTLGDREGDFNSAWTGISPELQFIFITAARDAIRGGFPDPKPQNP